MRVFEFSPGGYSPKHSHDWEHEMFIHSGEGDFYHNGKWTTAKTGSVVFIPSNEEHQIRNSGKDLLIVVCPLESKATEL
ncbi:Cupin domain family protein (fragment) [Syntrophobacter sp. SbD1]